MTPVLRQDVAKVVLEAARGELSAGTGVEESSRLVEDLGLDSIRLMALAVAVEDHFCVALDAEDEQAIHTVGDLIEVVVGKLTVADLALGTLHAEPDRGGMSPNRNTLPLAVRPKTRRARIEGPPLDRAAALRCERTVGEALVQLARTARGQERGLRFVDRAEQETFVSWAEVAARSVEVACGLRDLGYGRGARIAIVFPTGEDFFAAFFGALLVGAAPVPLHPPIRLGRAGDYQQRTQACLRAAEVHAVLVDERVRRWAGAAFLSPNPIPDQLFEFAAPANEADEVGHGWQTMALSELPAAKLSTAGRSLADLPTGGYSPGDLAPGDLALVQFSSGTTNRPKPVALSHRALLVQGEILAGFWPDEQGTQHATQDATEHAGVSWLPLYHDMGLIGCVFPALVRGADLTLLGPEVFLAKPAAWLRAIARAGERGGAVVSPAPSFAFSHCAERVREEDLDGLDLSSWRAALNGSERVSPAAVRAFSERFVRTGFHAAAMTPVYGLAEAGLAVTFSALGEIPRARCFKQAALAAGRAEAANDQAVNDGDSHEQERHVELVSLGTPVPGFCVEIRDGLGVALGEQDIGNVWIAGPSLTDGYLGMPEETAQALIEGWLDTGDLGFVMAGELFLTGRAKEVIVLRGRKWAPGPIEDALGKLEFLAPGAIVATSCLPAGAGGEELWILAELRDRQTRTAAELAVWRQECRQVVREAAGLRAERVVLLEPRVLPRTTSGKIRREEALQQVLAAVILEATSELGTDR